MLLVLDLNELQSSEYKDYTQWLQYFGKMKEYEDVVPKIYEKLGELVYKIASKSV